MEKFLQKKNTLGSKLHKDTVLADVELGKYFSLNPVASDIWEILKKPVSKEEVVEKLYDTYEIDLEVCHHEVSRFINDMMDKGLVSKIPSK